VTPELSLVVSWREPTMPDRPTTQFLRIERTEAALRLSEATKTAILEAALDCIVTIDSRGMVLDWNPAAAKAFGYSASEAIGREMAELIIPESLRPMHRQGLAHAVGTGQDRMAGKRIEITALRRNGEEFPVELAITRIAAGPPPLFTGHIRDITARKQAEQRRSAELEVIRTLAQAASLAEAAPRVLCAVCESLGWDLGVIWRLEQEKQVLRCVHVWHAPRLQADAFVSATQTSQFARGTGLPGRIWASRKPEWIPDVTHDPNFPRASLAGKNGLHGAFGFPLRLGEDVLGVIEFFSREIREPNSEVLEMFSAIGSQIGQFIERNEAEEAIYRMNSDLERRVAEATAELRASQERFHKAFHGSPAMMTLIRQKDSKFVDVNAAFCRVSEFSPERVVGRTSQALQLWVETEQCRRFFKGVGSPGAARERELELRSRTGRIYPVLVTAEVIEVEREPHLLTVALDVSARKRAEQELRAALGQEKELSRLKTNFVNLVSHEFRTPLGVILSSTEILESYHARLDEQQRAGHLQDIRHATKQMAGLMDEVLLLGRVEAGKMQCKPEPFKLKAFCKRLMDEQLAVNNAKCPIVLQVGPNAGSAHGDEGLLRHVFGNLLSNAIKYSDCGKPVHFSVHREGNSAVFAVRDSGIGIPIEDQARLFQAFHRGQNVGEVPGTGLGLVIVKRCVDLHDGTIEFASELGAGTTVTVKLGLFEQAPTERALAELHLKPGRPTSKRRGKQTA
jgi:PAS domain S-box-containing protein